MNQSFANLPPLEFRATKGGSTGQILLFLAMAAGCAYLAFCSLTPDYWTNFSYYELEVIGKFVNFFPVPVRVLMCAALMVMCLNAARMKWERFSSETPLLILSKDGVSGFKNGFATEHTFISWDDFKNATTINKSEMGFYAKPAHLLAKRIAIGVSLPEIGVKYADMIPLIEAYQLAWAHSQLLGQTPGQRQPQQEYAPAPRDSTNSAPAPTRRSEPQPGQFAKPNVPDFGKRMTRL